MNIPENLKYTKDHEWVAEEGGVYTVGITDYAQSQLGDIVFVDVPTVGETVEAGEVFGTVEAVKTVADMMMPISGEVTEFNEELENAPDLVNKDAYGEGWIIKISASGSEFGELLSPAEYKDYVGA